MSSKITPELFNAFISGDQQAGNTVFSIYYEPVNTYIRRITKSNADSKELTQEVFIEFWLRRSSIRSIDTFYGYLITIARNITMQYFRDRKKNIHIPLDLDKVDIVNQEREHDVESNYITLENELLLEKIISEMPEQRGKIFTMHKIQGLPVAQIAEELNLSKRTVENHIYIAVRELKKVFLMLTLLAFSLYYTVIAKNKRQRI